MANYIVNAYNNGGSDGSVNMRSGPAKPTALLPVYLTVQPHARWDATSWVPPLRTLNFNPSTSCEVGRARSGYRQRSFYFNPPTSCEVGQQKSLTVIVS